MKFRRCMRTATGYEARKSNHRSHRVASTHAPGMVCPGAHDMRASTQPWSAQPLKGDIATTPWNVGCKNRSYAASSREFRRAVYFSGGDGKTVIRSVSE